MMEDIEAGEINIVLGKDLSRFGGEYAQMGLYIEHSFEQKTVRFIAVSENIDTANGTGSLVFPFTNVVNSYYARQCSTKAKAAHGARAKTGMYLGATPRLGISRILREKRILNPQAYFNQNNPMYLGKVVFGRRKTKGFFDKSIVDVPEQDWIVGYLQ